MAAGMARNLVSLLYRAAAPSVRARLAAGMVIGVAASGLAAVAPLALKQLVDAIAAGNPPAAALASGALYLLATGIGRAAALGQTYLFAATDHAIHRALGGLMFERLLRLPLCVIQQKPAGGLAQIQQHALQGVRLLVSLVCLTLIPVLVQMIIILTVVASVFDIRIWLIVATALAAYLIVFSWGAQRTAASTGSAIDAQVRAGKVFADGLANAETVKNLVAETAIAGRYRGILASAEGHWRAALARRIEVGLAVAVVFVSTMAAALLAGGQAAQAGTITVGDFVLLHAYLLQIIAPLEQTGYAMRDIGQGATYARGWHELSQLPLENAAQGRGGPAGATAAARGPPAIQFRNVSLKHGETAPSLTDVSFDVPPGAVVALVGASGAGKSSILRLLLGHYPLAAGTILIDGDSVDVLDPHTIRGRAAAMSSDAMLLDGTLAYNLRLARPDADDAALQAAIEAAGLGGLVASLPQGLLTEIGDRGLRLSSGERQRLAIARCVLRESDILLLDEPTSALDPVSEQLIAATIARAARGRTTLIATHRLLLASGADAIVVLEEGRVAEMGAHTDLLRADGLYAALWRAQMREEQRRSAAAR